MIPKRHQRWWLPAAVALILALASAPGQVAPAVLSAPSFLETFDYAAGQAPGNWNPQNWAVSVHSRDVYAWHTLDTSMAHHNSATCAGYPDTHTTNTYEGAVFLCNDHAMTSINAAGYGLVYLTPPALLDFSAGTAILSFDMSTLRTSPRDWMDVWIMPFGTNLQFPLDEWIPDGNGLPEKAIHLRMDNGSQGSIFRVTLYDNYVEVATYENFQPGLEVTMREHGTSTDASRRDTFELELSTSHIKWYMPDYNIVFADAALPGLAWNQGTVMLGHHSYNPTKDCPPGECVPDTWHWDNVQIEPARPFSIIRPDRRHVDTAHPGPFTMQAPAPAGAFVRFMAIGNALELRFLVGGAWGPWIAAVEQGHSKANQDEIFKSYWQAAPTGATQADVRGVNWWGGDWLFKDMTIWAQSAPTTPATPALPTATPRPPTATRTATVAPAATATQGALPSTATMHPSSNPVSPTSATPGPPAASATATLAPISTVTPTAVSSPTPTATSILATPTPTAAPTMTPPAATATPEMLDVPCRLDENVLTCLLPD